jgi:Transposase DDE domain group 1
MHIYHVASGTPIAAILRPARTPKGTEVRCLIKHVAKRLRQHWPNTRIVWRGDSHYGRVEAMEWAEEGGADYIFGLAGNTALDALVAETAENLRFHHAVSNQAKLRTYASFMYQASSWTLPRKARWPPLKKGVARPSAGTTSQIQQQPSVMSQALPARLSLVEEMPPLLTDPRVKLAYRAEVISTKGARLWRRP